MAKKEVLGKGLAALFEEIENESNAFQKNSEDLEDNGVMELPIEEVIPNPNQPRRTFNEAALQELTQSVKTFGIIQPIIVTEKSDGKYVIIAGERRYRAAKNAGLKNVPAIIRDFSEKERKEIAIIENIQRENLNPIEEAAAFKTLIDEYNVTQEQLAETLGKSRPAITNALRLLTLTQSVQELIIQGKLKAGHARCLAVIKDEDIQLKFAELTIEKRLSVRELEQAVADYMKPIAVKSGVPKQKLRQNSEIRAFVLDMQRTFATKVKLTGDENKGKIQIEYYSKDDLSRIFDLMTYLKSYR